MKLDGKIAVITGGSSGIGLATAKTFLAEGARVYVTGRRKPELDAAVAPLGPNAVAVQGDVSKPADLDRLYNQSVRRLATSMSCLPTPASAASRHWAA